MQNISRIEPGSEAWEKLTEMMARPGDPRAISIASRSTTSRVQLKWGGGTWTTPLSTINLARADGQDHRTFAPGECGHLICAQCKGHKSYDESEAHDGHEHSCYCCKHCNQPGGH